MEIDDLALWPKFYHFEVALGIEGLKNKHHKDTCFKAIGLCLQIFIEYYTLNNDTRLGGLVYSIRKSTIMHLW